MNKIQILPDNIINQIAAGEVIENPSSVAKELIENSIDSGASDIKIIIKEGGHNLIQVSDNGCGLNKDDIQNFIKSQSLHLEKIILKGADLRSINFARANLRGADLSRANLRGANLTGVNLTEVFLLKIHLFINQAIINKKGYYL